MGRGTKQNQITSPELLSQVNPKNQRLARDFLEYLSSVGRSDSTIRGYQSDLDIIMVFLLQKCDNKFFVDLTKRDVISFQNWLIVDHENSPARVRRLKAVMSSLSNYISNILDDEYPNYRPIVRKIESPVNTPSREKTVVTDEECARLLEALVEQGKYEQACLFALAMASGRRKSELLRFKVSYFAEENIVFGSLYKTPEKVRSKGRGKNGKMLTMYVLVKDFKPYFERWMREREQKGIESEWLFPNRNNPAEPRSVSSVDHWFKQFSVILGKPSYPHMMRHYFSTRLAKAGIPDDVIQAIVGWESSDMVRIYKDIDVADDLGKYFRDGEILSAQKTELSAL